MRRGSRKRRTLLRDLGHEVEEAAPPLTNEILSQSFMALWASGLALQIDGFAMVTGKQPNDNEIEGLTWGLYQAGKQVTAVQYQMAIAQMQDMSRAVAHFMERYDAWMTPTLGAPPLKIGTIDIHERDPVKAFEPIIDYVPFTAIENATGQPHDLAAAALDGRRTAGRHHVSVPLRRRGCLIRLAAQLEEARPWKDKHPKIWN